MMHLTGIGTATPSARCTKAECLAAFERSDWFTRLDSRAHFIARTVLQRDNGIEARRLAVDALDEVFVINPDTLSQRFLTHAPRLAAQAGERALKQAGLQSAQVDAAALPNLMLGRALLTSGACEHVLSICVEVSSAAMYLDNDPGVLISAWSCIRVSCATALPCCANTAISQAPLSTSYWKRPWRMTRRPAGGG